MADTTTFEFDCQAKNANFCYVCAKYVNDKSKTKFTKLSQERYMKLFQVQNLKNFGFSFVGKAVCGSCKGRLCNRTKHEGKFNVPAIWHGPKNEDHDDCYLCQTNLSDHEKRYLIWFSFRALCVSTAPNVFPTNCDLKNEPADFHLTLSFPRANQRAKKVRVRRQSVC